MEELKQIRQKLKECENIERLRKLSYRIDRLEIMALDHEKRISLLELENH